jgi:tryptophan synthase alpha chain
LQTHTAASGRGKIAQTHKTKYHTMSRIKELFKQKNREVLNVYCTAGYPNLNSTVTVMEALQKSGVDIIELGIPYSDPVADGPTIQKSNMQALENGMSVSVLFQQLQNFRNKINIPVILMGYLNPVLQYGFEKFCVEAAALGIDGFIIPDLPVDAFEKEYGSIVHKSELDFIFLITPETPPGRIKKLDELSSGFLYAVTSSSTTGAEKNAQMVEDYLINISGMKLQNPLLAGFGIKNNHDFKMVCKYVSGAIVGSAYINQLAGAANIETATEPFIKMIRG